MASTLSTSAPPSLPSGLHALFAREASTIPLVPRTPFSTDLQCQIATLSRSSHWSDALTSSLHVLNDDIDAAHEIVTDLDSDDGCNLVHAILHRREGDYWNSKYWYSRIDHPFVRGFYQGGRSGAKAYVDQVEAVAKGKKAASSACGAKNLIDEVKRTQERELKALVVALWNQQQQQGV